MEEQQRQFKGIWIPKDIWLSENLTFQEKAMLVEIDSLEDEIKGCWASNKHFTNMFQVTSSRVSQIIKSLEEKGYIQIEYEMSGKEITARHIRINRPPYPELNRYVDSLKGVCQKTKEGYVKKLKESNTYISNTNEYIYKKENIKEKRFQIPTLEEIQQYILEKELKVNPETFKDYYESNGWMVGKSKMKDWKATIRNWNRKDWNNNKNKKVTTTSWIDKEIPKEEIGEYTDEERKRFGID